MLSKALLLHPALLPEAPDFQSFPGYKRPMLQAPLPGLKPVSRTLGCCQAEATPEERPRGGEASLRAEPGQDGKAWRACEDTAASAKILACWQKPPRVLRLCQHVSRKRAKGTVQTAAFTLVFHFSKALGAFSRSSSQVLLSLHHSSFSHCNS